MFCIFPVALQAQTSELTRSAAQNFEGFSLQAAVGYQPYSVKFTELTLSKSNLKLDDRNSDNYSIPYFIGASYTAAISHNLTLGAQIEVNPTNQQYVLSILPGYAFTSDVQGYLKLAWVSATLTVDESSVSNTVSGTLNGMTAGLGLKKFWTSNWYSFVEANYVKMETIKFNSTVFGGVPLSGKMDYNGYNAMIGIGYKF